MNQHKEFSDQIVRQSEANLIQQGQLDVQKIRGWFEDISTYIEYGIALQYLLEQNGDGSFGLKECVDELIDDLQQYRGEMDSRQAGRDRLLEITIIQLTKDALELPFASEKNQQ